MPAYKDKKNNTWYASFYYINWKGEKKIKKKRGFKRQKDALEYEKDFLNKESGNCDITFNNLVQLYLEDMEVRLKSSTMDTKRNIIDSKILPYFKLRKINEIRSSDIRHWQSTLIKENNYSQTYLKTVNNQLSTIFNYAVKHYNLKNNPCHIAGSMGKKNADSMQIWTVKEYKQFIKFVDKPASIVAFDILFWSGIREGELLGLTVKDILNTKQLNINKTYYRRNGKEIISTPKTPKSIRKVAIPNFVYDEIKNYISKLYGIQEDDRIFYFSKSYLNTELKNGCKLANIKKIRVHDLRHSHASLLIELGYNAVLIAERLGHENISTTLDTYSHLYPDKQKKVADKLDILNSNIIMPN